MKRVVVTGIGAITPLGATFGETWGALLEGKSGVRLMPEWSDIVGLRTRIAAPAASFELPEHYTRKRIRSMSRAGLMATRSAEMALEDAGLLGDPVLTSGETGVAFGSCLAGSDMLLDIAKHCIERDSRGMQASAFTQAMSHSCAANIGIFFGCTGRILPTSSACTSASQGIGYAAEAIRAGQQTVMIAGGAEELSVPLLLLFDSMYATSPTADEPLCAPRPFDAKRDGLVIAEGACSLILEELSHAQARGATIYAELVGYGTNSDGVHITAPTPATMRAALMLSLRDAQMSPQDIEFVHAHATGTPLGDASEVDALTPMFGDKVPVGALKSYFGHTLGACGSLEAALTIKMMREKTFLPIRNLEGVSADCEGLHLIFGTPLKREAQCVMSNNFAFGGVNTSLIFKRI
jgi:3-oxoacyl-[acyl-carrier-protein] synthase II